MTFPSEGNSPEEENTVAITEQSRHELYRHLIETMGEERAGTLMAHLPPVGWAEVATKQDLEHLQTVMDLRFEGMDRRLDGVEGGLASVRSEIADLRAHLDHKLSTQLLAVLGFTLSFAGLLVAAAHLA
ncbi:MAG: hypothetical protein M3394_01535 [Actinomycetota bacterium]|nr:hypothetical protein [Actinomycetota bacterium]